MWKKKALILTAAAGLLVMFTAGCSSAPSTPDPQPVDTSFAVSVKTAVNLLAVLWDGMSIEEQQLVCMSYLSDEDAAWAAFNSGARDNIPHSAFVYFFESHC